MGFHIDGFARELLNRPERLTIPVPDSVSFEDAACAPIGFGTVQHMLFDNAKLEPAREHPHPCRRLRHRHGGDPDGEGDWLHGLHHSWR